MEDWARRHVGDHCGFHHREFVLLQILELKGVHASSVNMRLRGSEDLVSKMQNLTVTTEQKVCSSLNKVIIKRWTKEC
jgi:hypothetical protein